MLCQLRHRAKGGKDVDESMVALFHAGIIEQIAKNVKYGLDSPKHCS
jgi:hypothetical protein